MEQYNPLSLVADFATLVGTYETGFVLLLEPGLGNFTIFFSPTVRF